MADFISLNVPDIPPDNNHYFDGKNGLKPWSKVCAMLDLNGSQKTLVIGLLCAANAAYLMSSWRGGEIRRWLPLDIVDFELPKVICFSPAEMVIPVGQLLTSLAIILGVCVLSQQARRLVDTHITDGLVRGLLFEAIAAADLCGCCFELIIVADNFGVWTYAVLLFVLTLWWGKAWGDATACPYTHLEDVITGKVDTQMALMKTWAELTGGVLVFRLIQGIWSLELIDTHEGRSDEDCNADLQVAMVLGSVIEGFATCLCQLVGKALSDVQPKHGDIIGSFIGTSLVVAAFNYTGGYFNPVLATALKFGCQGHTVTEHMVVYWGGACVGSALSVFLYNHTRLKDTITSLAGREAKEEEEEEEYEKEE